MTAYQGVEHSIQAMRDAILGPRGDLSPLVRFHCERICEEVAPKDYLSEIQAIRYWVLTHAPYFNDPTRVEWVRDPQALLEQIQASRTGVVRADCDEITLLMAALWMACGKEVELVTVGFTPNGPHSHVFLRCKIPGAIDQWVVVDPVAGTREPSMLTKVKSYKFWSLQ